MIFHYENPSAEGDFTSFVRVVISSANLMAYDYEQVQNIVYVQDFPNRLVTPSCSPKGDHFRFELIRHLKAMKVPTSIYENLLDKVDFSKASAWIVASVPGNYAAAEMPKNPIGLFHLSWQISCLKNEIENEMKDEIFDHFEFQASSIGTLTTSWLQDLSLAMQGRLGVNANDIGFYTAPKFKIIFPSLKMVQDSILGYGGFGTIFLGRKAYESKEFPRNQFCGSMSSQTKDAAVSLHCKIFSAWFMKQNSRSNISNEDAQSSSAGTDAAANLDVKLKYLYHGSHNISGAAWGTLTKKRDKFMIRNYELGVIIGENYKKDESDPRIKELFPTELSRLIPYRVPPSPYRKGEDIPWIQEEWLQ